MSSASNSCGGAAPTADDRSIGEINTDESAGVMDTDTCSSSSFLRNPSQSVLQGGGGTAAVLGAEEEEGGGCYWGGGKPGRGGKPPGGNWPGGNWPGIGRNCKRPGILVSANPDSGGSHAYEYLSRNLGFRVGFAYETVSRDISQLVHCPFSFFV